jgi:hypothetical protein
VSSCESGNEPWGSIKCWEILATSQEGPSSMELVINPNIRTTKSALSHIKATICLTVTDA